MEDQMGSVSKIIKKVIPKEIVEKVVSTPTVPAPAPAPKPEPAPPPVAAVSTPAPTPAPAPTPTPPPAVEDPAPVTPDPQETEETEQTIMRKKKGRKKTIITGTAGLGGEAPTYTTVLS